MGSRDASIIDGRAALSRITASQSRGALQLVVPGEWCRLRRRPRGQMVPHVCDLPDDGRAVEQRIDCQVLLPSDQPRGDVVSATHRGCGQRHTVDGRLHALAVAGVEDRWARKPSVSSWRLFAACTGYRLVVRQ